MHIKFIRPKKNNREVNCQKYDNEILDLLELFLIVISSVNSV